MRNPIYSVILLAASGMALTSSDVAALLGLALVFAPLWRKALVEERLLVSKFGEQYAAHSRRVKRLIPCMSRGVGRSDKSATPTRSGFVRYAR